MSRASKQQPLLEVSEVQVRLGLKTPDSVWRLIDSGDLRAVNIGVGKVRRNLRISEEALAEFLERRQVKPPAPTIPHVRRTRKNLLDGVTKYFRT